MRARISILLSTYNGQPFLRDLLDSLAGQTYTPWSVLARDDGSTDGTVDEIEEWSETHPCRIVPPDGHLGAARSFLRLLKQADPTCDYYSFCDQDDVWLPNKLADAVEMLEGCQSRVPLLYCSALEYVSADLRHLGHSRTPRVLGFANALVENVASGCTVVLNSSARELLVESMPVYPLMHDWWSYIVLSACGQVIFDPRVNVRYRQHEGNAVGAATGVGGLFVRRASRLLKRKYGSLTPVDQAREFRRLFGRRLSTGNLALLEDFLKAGGDWRARLKYSSQMNVWRQSRIDSEILRLLIVAGHFCTRKENVP